MRVLKRAGGYRIRDDNEVVIQEEDPVSGTNDKRSEMKGKVKKGKGCTEKSV